MNPIRWLAVAAVLALGLGTISCGDDEVVCEPGKYTKECPPRKGLLDLRILEAKRYLSEFQGERAREVFLDVNKDHREFYKGKSYCPAVYGVLLADAQIIVKNFNGLLLRTFTSQLFAAPDGSGGWRTSANASFRKLEGKPFDFGNLIANAWSSFEPTLLEMGAYASAVTAMQGKRGESNCAFDIGLEEPYKETLKANPYKYVINLGDSDLPLVQIMLQARFDGAEARMLGSLSYALLGFMDFLLAHEFSLAIDIVKIGHQLGFPVDCLKQDVLACFDEFEAGKFDEGFDVRGWSFLFQDNPKLLAKSETTATKQGRWDDRMGRVDNEFAAAFYPMRTFFEALVARALNYSTQAAANEKLGEFFITYKDGNSNGLVDTFDSIGLNIKDIELDPSYIIQQAGLEGTPEEKKLRDAFDTLNSGADSALIFVKNSLKPTKGAVEEIEVFLDRAYGNFAAVDNPNVTRERIPISSFNVVIEDMLLAFIDQATPPFMEFDVTAYFTNPKPLRDFVPHWERKPYTVPGSWFLIDSDTYYVSPTSSATIKIPDLFFKSYAFSFSSATNGLTMPTGGEHAMFTNPSYDGGLRGVLTNLSVPTDCINSMNLHAENTQWPVMSLSLPDPTFNGMIYVDLDQWANTYDPGTGNGAACGANDPPGIQQADNYAITKAMWMYVDFLIDHFQFAVIFGEL